MTKHALLFLFSASLAACSLRSYPTIADAVGEPAAPPKLPPTPTFLTNEYVTTADAVSVRFVDVCQAGDCAYQIFKARLDDPSRKAWTDCGLQYEPRKNGEAEADPQDGTCTLTTIEGRNDRTLQVTLEDRSTQNDTGGRTPTQIQVRARNGLGFVSEQASLTVVRDAQAPAAPQNVEAIAGNGTVIVNWTPSTSPDVTGYLIYYGTSPPSSSTWPELNSRLAANGASPVFVPGREVSSIALANFPNGQTIYVGVTARDDACVPIGSTPLGEPICGVHESDKGFDPALTQPNATPGEFSVRELAKYVQPPGSLARAVATHGDLVVLVSASADEANPATIVETFDLRTLTTFGATLDGAAARLGVLTLPESLDAAKRKRCEREGPSAPSASILNVSKQVQIFGRYAFIASGTGFVYAVDLANPSSPSKAWANDAMAATGGGCALGLDLQWPHLLIADGVANDEVVGDDLTAGVIEKSITRDPITGILTATTVSCVAPTFDGSDTVQAISFTANNDFFHHDGILYLGNDGATQRCVTIDVSGFCPSLGGSTCTSVTIGRQFSSDVVRFQRELPLMVQASLQQELSVLSDEDIDGDFQDSTPDQAVSIDTQGPVFATAAAGRYLFAAVGNRRGVDVIDLEDQENPAAVGNVFTGGDARDVAIAGPYLLAVNEPTTPSDERVGLRVYSLAQSFVLVNGGSQKTSSTVGVDGLRGFFSDPMPQFANQNFFQQSLRSLSYTPIPVSSGGGSDSCFNLDVGLGMIACGARASNIPPLATRPCMTTTTGTSSKWPASCFGRADSPTTVRALALAGPDFLMAYTFAGSPIFRTAPLSDLAPDGWRFLNLATYTFGNDAVVAGTDNDDADFAGPLRVPLPASETLVSGAKIASFGAKSAVQTTAAVHVIDRPTGTHRAFANLKGAAFGVTDVCGVIFRDQHAFLTCLDAASGILRSEIDLGPSACTDAAVARFGQTTAVELIHTTQATNACEGVVIVDQTASGAPPSLTKLSVNTNHPSIVMQGENVYVSCRLPSESLCQLRLRR